jgi:flagellar biosynthesis/type III secretory pathway chaperone
MLRQELAAMMTEETSDEATNQEDADTLLEISEDDLVSALVDELGTPTEETPLSEAQKEIEQYKQAIAELKGQLVEMNLFNAKLLYANKLMQNKDLNMKQQKAIVEALDNAKTLREAKLLFKSLTESLSRRTGSKKLSEGSLRTIGSSSKSTRSATPKNNGSESDRWAVLAGLSRD